MAFIQPVNSTARPDATLASAYTPGSGVLVVTACPPRALIRGPKFVVKVGSILYHVTALGAGNVNWAIPDGPMEGTGPDASHALGANVYLEFTEALIDEIRSIDVITETDQTANGWPASRPLSDVALSELGTATYADLTGNPDLSGGVDATLGQVKIQEDWGFSGSSILTPAQITANQDNYAPTGIGAASVLRLSTDASRNITGISAPSPEYARRLIVQNIGSFNVVLKDDVTSTAANRFQLTADVTLTPMQHVELIYDTTLDRWVLIGGTGGSITDHTHESAGAQGGTLDEDALALTDVTTNNASTTKHGFLKKLSNTASQFMNGVGNWVAVSWNDLTDKPTLPAYTLTNVTTDRTLDANSTTLDEVADVLGTLIDDLTDAGMGGGGGASVSRGAYASRPAAGTAGRLYLATDTPILSFDDGSVWHEYSSLDPIPNDTFPATWVNQGGASVDTSKGGVYLLVPAGAGFSARMRVKSAPSPPYTIVAKIVPHIHNVDYNSFGVLFRQSSDGKWATLRVFSNGGQYALWSDKFTDATTYSANYAQTTIPLSGPIWFKLVDDNTNRIVSWSTNGVFWHQVHSVGRTDFLTADQVGFFAGSENGSWPAAIWVQGWDES